MKHIVVIAFLTFITSCNLAKKQEHLHILENVDNANIELTKAIANFHPIATIDHHRLAKEVGVYTPPSVATVFSDKVVNTPLVAKNQLAGLDLPFKILCYSEPDTSEVSIAFTSAEFISKRHLLPKEDLKPYDEKIKTVLSVFSENIISNTETAGVVKEFGIIKIQSDFDFNTTVNNLKAIVESQEDTQWFADVDYQNDAKTLNVSIRPTTLLLFGAPAPGAKAMMTTPKIGLDAFCQKLLVFQNDADEVWIAFNDIVAFSELYYGSSTKPQKMINQRITMTFTKAIKTEVDQ